MSAEAWIAGIALFVSLPIGIWGLIEARRARSEAARSNMLASEANELAERALGVAEGSLQLQELEVGLVQNQHMMANSADLRVNKGPCIQTVQGFTLGINVENRGPHIAKDVTVSLNIGDLNRYASQARDIRPFNKHKFEFQTYSGPPEREGSTAWPEERGELTVKYSDGNDSYEEKWDIQISPGRTQAEREFTFKPRSQ